MREHILFLLVVYIKTLFLYDAWCANSCGKYDFPQICYVMILQILVMLRRPSQSVKHLTRRWVERKEKKMKVEKGKGPDRCEQI